MAPLTLVFDDVMNVRGERLEAELAQLPDWRREVALRYKFEGGRAECCMAYRLLQKALLQAYGIDDAPEFVISEHGKPLLKDYPHIHFNLSHCQNAVACVVAPYPVGVDVERIDRYKDSLARYVLNDEELQSVQQSANPGAAFARLWTQKEAVFKLIGTGITDDTRDILQRYSPLVNLTTQVDLVKGYAISVCNFK